MGMSDVYPSTPVPSSSIGLESTSKTAVTEFDSGAEVRRSLLRFQKRGYSLGYDNRTRSEKETIRNFIRLMRGSYDYFWFVDFQKQNWNDEFIGRSTLNSQLGALAQDDAEKNTLLHLNGTGGSTTIVDEYTHSTGWSCNGTAQLSTSAQRFGSACLLLDGDSDYIRSTFYASLGAGAWTIEGWFRFDVVNKIHTLLSFLNASGYGAALRWNNTGTKLELYLSGNGSSWSIANGTGGTRTTWSSGVWYKYALVFTGSAYKVYVGEAGMSTTEDISVVSSTSINGSLTQNDFGAQNSSNYLDGRLDEIRISIGTARYTSTFYPETSELPFDSGFTIETTASNNTTANDMTLLPTTPQLNDAYYFGGLNIFDLVRVQIGTIGSGTWTITWEYWNGSAWTALSSVTDGTSNFRPTAAGTYDVLFDRPTNWGLKTIKGISAYWARARVSAFTSSTTAPKGTQSWLTQLTYDLHSLNTTSGTLKVYVDGDLKTAGGVDFTLLTGSGYANSDRIKFAYLPTNGSLITCDFEGNLRIKARFKDDYISEILRERELSSFKVSIQEIQW